MPEKSVADKLLIKPNTTVWLSDASRAGLLAPLPEGVTRVESLAEANTATLFADDAASLTQELEALKGDLGKPNALWIAYPKGNRADINRDTLWPLLSPFGMRPVTQVAIDEVWSALRFRPLKPGETFNPGGN
jgi:hypothetical protein